MENYTVDEVCNILKLHFQSVLKLLRSNELQGFKAGREWRVTKQDLETYINTQKEKQLNK